MSTRSIRRAHVRRVAADQRRLRRLGVLAGATALGIGAPSADASNAPITVTNLNNSGAGSLRAAIASANAAAGDDTILFQSGLTGIIRLTTGALPIIPAGSNSPDALTITGPGAGTLTISGDKDNSGTFNTGDSQIFSLTSAGGSPDGLVTISGLTLTRGFDPAGGTGGGAIHDASGEPLAFTDDVITNNRSDVVGNTSHGGGAISTGGQISLTNTTLSGNVASASNGGAIWAKPKYVTPGLTLVNSTISGNTARNGGGMYTEGGLQIQGSHVTANTATGDPSSFGSAGGGIESLAKYESRITGSVFSGNTAIRGGGVYIGAAGIFGSAPSVLDTVISGNHAPHGAGIAVGIVTFGVDLTIARDTITGNLGGPNSSGGGVLVAGQLLGTLDLVDSTITGNSAVAGAGISVGDELNDRVFGQYNGSQAGELHFDNTTIASNAAGTHGGGIYLASYDFGSPPARHSAPTNLASTIVFGNTAAGAAQDLDRADDSTAGGVTSLFSLIGTPGDAPLAQTSSLIGVDPKLGALADNGGPTQTMKPAGDSPVIDQGHASTRVPADQRGQTRTVDSGIANPEGGDGTDIGAVELDKASVILPPPAPTPVLSVSIRGTSIANPVAPLLAAGNTPVDCSVSVGTLTSCVIEVRAASATSKRAKTVAAGTLLGSGDVTSAGAAKLTTTITLNSAGRAVLAKRPLGLDVLVGGVPGGSGAAAVGGKAHLLKGPSITLHTITRSTKLPKSVLTQLDQAAVLLKGATTVSCTAFTDKRGSSRADKRLTSTQAKAACSRMVAKGLSAKVTHVGKGHSGRVASNRTPTGRAANRRIVIKFGF